MWLRIPDRASRVPNDGCGAALRAISCALSQTDAVPIVDIAAACVASIQKINDETPAINSWLGCTESVRL
jgi:hypothetical protein